jgi:hypothetical protein
VIPRSMRIGRESLAGINHRLSLALQLVSRPGTAGA